MVSFFGKFFGSTISEAAGYGIGSALEKPIEPVLQEITNETWRASVKAGVRVPIDAGDAAEVVAEDVRLEPWGADQAAQLGIGPEQFSALVEATKNAPGFGELLRIYRRHPKDGEEFTHGLRKNRLEDRWDPHLTELADERLAPAVIALAIVRGIMQDPGFLPVGPPTTEGKVKAFPVSPIPTLEEAAAHGFDKERLFVETAVAGRPPGPVEAAQASFRNIIEYVDFQRAIAEGDVRNEWAEALYEVSRQILTAGQYAELELRGYYDQATRRANTAKHGMSDADSDLLYNVLGRSISVHAVTTGLARGGKYPGSYANVPSPYKEAIQRSNIREEYSELAYANRYSYPSGFQIKAEVKAGDLSAAEGEQILLEVGWSPKWAKFFPEKWAGQGAGTASSATKSATTKAVNAVSKAYIQEGLSQADATAELTKLGEDPATFPGLFSTWDVSRTAYLQGLSNTQIRNRFRLGQISEAEGAAMLEARGVPAADATAYLKA